MDEHGAGDASASADRLEELEQVTREYAKGAEACGLAGLVGGAVLAAEAVIAARLSRELRVVVSLLGPLGTFVWMTSLAIARRLYQRRGWVRPSTTAMPWLRRWHLVTVYLGAVNGIFAMAVGMSDFRPNGVGAWLGVLGPALVLPVLVPLASSMRGRDDLIVAVVLLITPSLTNDLWRDPSLNGAQRWGVAAVAGGLLAVMVLCIAGAGVRQHLALRRLGPRLDALRERGFVASSGEGS